VRNNWKSNTGTMIEPKFKLYDQINNKEKPEIVCFVAQVRIICRGEPDERAVYTVTYDKKNGERGLIHDVEENRIQLHQPSIFE
jgi:hypothetical protein